MRITIVHLYYDLLNLYGESGNIKALKSALDKQGIETRIIFKTLDDTLTLDDYDFLYLGMGTEENQFLALSHLIKYRKDIKKFIEDGKFVLATGSAHELFGKYIETPKKKTECLNIFPHYSKREVFRIVDEALFKYDNKYVLGFQNQGSVTKGNNSPWFEVVKGTGSYPGSTTEGFIYKNFYGTYLIGPLLARNPHILKKLVTDIILSKDNNYQLKDFDLELEENAYNQFIKNNYEKYQN